MLDLAGVQKLHEYDQRPAGLPVPCLDHLHLTGRYSGKCGKSGLGIAGPLADRLEGGWGHGFQLVTIAYRFGSTDATARQTESLAAGPVMQDTERNAQIMQGKRISRFVDQLGYLAHQPAQSVVRKAGDGEPVRPHSEPPLEDVAALQFIVSNAAAHTVGSLADYTGKDRFVPGGQGRRPDRRHSRGYPAMTAILRIAPVSAIMPPRPGEL